MITAKQKKQAWPAVLILGALVSAHLCFWLFPALFETWNAQAVDRLFVLRSSRPSLRPAYDHTVVHVDLNNSSRQRLHNPYLNRAQFARLVRNLAAMHLRAQAFDFILAAPLNPAGDNALVKAVRAAGNVYFGLAFRLRRPDQPRTPGAPPAPESPELTRTLWRITVQGDPASLFIATNPLITFPDLARASRGLGSLSVKFDRDGVLRRVPLLVRYGNAYYPLLPFRVVCDYLGVSPDKIILRPGHEIILQDAKKPGRKIGHDIVIPIDAHGNMRINYVGPWESMDHYSFADILLASDDQDELEMWADELAGKIAVVADVSTGSADVGPVPTDPDFPLSGVHANIINSILTESFLKDAGGWQMLTLELLLAALLWLTSRLASLYFSIGTVSLAALYLGSAGAAFLWGHVVLNIVRPLVMIALAMVAILVYSYINEEREKMESLRQRDFIRSTFGRYLSSEVVEELLESPAGLKMKGELREVTFLVSDLRGFTAISAGLSPQQVIAIMNRYFEPMVEIISRYRGTVNEFQGDGILAFFGAPLHTGDDPQRAVACAIEMQNALQVVNQTQRRLRLPELAMGIGINTGEVVVGNIGSQRRAAYAAVGTPINVAYRVESITVGGQILISPSTYAKVKSVVQVSSVRPVRFKGVDQPVKLYEVAAMQAPYNVFLPEKKMTEFTRLDSALQIGCFALEGKAVSEQCIPGHIIQLGPGAAKASLQKAVQLHSNLRIVLGSGQASNADELYAKVSAIEAAGPQAAGIRVQLQFTWLSEGAKRVLAQAAGLAFS